jgi:hypothetical protein
LSRASSDEPPLIEGCSLEPRLAKRAVNHTMDTMGFSTAIASCFDMHHLGHTRALAATGGKTVVMADLERRRPRVAPLKRRSTGKVAAVTG